VRRSGHREADVYAQQPWDAPQPSAVAVTAKYHPLAFVFGLCKPQIELNGRVVALGWGRHVVPVPAGQYLVHVHVPYLLPPRLGPADLGVAVLPGGAVELEYRAPMINFIDGALGAPPQKWPGIIASIILLVALLCLVLCLGGAVVALMFANSTSSASGLW
jgi:hypothetical protein